MIQVSDDGGKTWDTREAPSVAAPIDVAVNPGNPKVWAVSTDQGVFVSQNEGRSWRQRDTTFGARIVWAAPDARYAAIRERMVTDPDQADPGLLEWARTHGRALLEASS